ncbi:acetoin dehydrogenase dihydrolipoyllysine-residue acetyltransferase subunit [Xanthobacter sp. AM11]|uniref:acetoin dehydrogenase dihydrolipoyllysine-residue acetyltransferase subunit n=1 Tax=Xanthobacter sp. AM11 TaxID=3380643 RepID=UPI0039BF3FA6
MPKEILMPALAAGMEEGHLVRWLKKEGAPVKAGDLLAEIETDKAVMEMEAEADGRLGPILVGDGTRAVAVGTLIASILAEGEAAPEPAAAPAAAMATLAPAAPAAPPQPAPVRPAAAPVAAPSRPVPTAPFPPLPPSPALAPSIAALVTARKVVASPLARRLADDYGLDLSRLSGSGPRGRIVRLDVERARDASARPAPVPQPRRSGAAAPGLLHHAWLRQGEGRPVVLLHGFGSDLNGWRPFLAGGSPARPLLGLDLPGHGGSAAVAAAGFDALVEAVAGTLEGLGLLDVDVVAHSLGAAVAVALAAEGHIGVRSLFLLSPAGLGPDINGAFVGGLARARTAQSLAPWMGELVADPAVLTPAFLRAAAAARADDTLIDAQQRLAAVLFPDGTQAFGVRGRLEQLAVPVTIVFGQDDRIIPWSHTRRVPGEVALHLFPGVGHLPQLEVRDAVWRLLDRHLRTAG